MLRNEKGGPETSGRLFYLDFIRVAACFLIVVYHFPVPLLLRTDWLHATVGNGGWGNAVVYVFFMISGAALFYSYGKEKPFSAKIYFKKRILAIYPLFYIAYIAAFFVVFWVLGQTYQDVPSYAVIWSILGLDGYLHDVVPNFFTVGEWFIGAILLVYFCFPVLRRAAFAIGLSRLLLIIAVPALYFMAAPSPLGMETKKNLFVDLFFFLLGAWIEERRSLNAARAAGSAEGEERGNTVLQKQTQKNTHADCEKYAALGRSEKKHTRRARRLVLTGGLSFALLLAWLLIPVPLFSTEPLWQNFQRNFADSFAAVCLYLCLFALAYLIAHCSSWLSGLITRVAAYTYGVFLVHHFVESRICDHFQTELLTNRDRIVLLMLCLAGVVFFTFLLYRTKAVLSAFLCGTKRKA